MCLEPTFQLNFGSSVASHSWADLYVGQHVFAFHLLQLYIFRRYDFVSMYAFRFVYTSIGMWNGVLCDRICHFNSRSAIAGAPRTDSCLSRRNDFSAILDLRL